MSKRKRGAPGRAVTPEQQVHEFLRRSKVSLPRSFDRLLDNLAERYGEPFVERIEDMVPPLPEHAQGLRDVIFRDLEMARLAYVLDSPGVVKWLEYWAGLTLPEGDLVDLGCGGGLATCFYAAARPGAKAIGIDRSEPSIARAREFAAELRLDNVEFVLGDALTAPLPERHFAVVVSTLVAHEIAGLLPLEYRGFSTLPLIEERLGGGQTSPLIERAGRLLAPTGRYLSWERLFDEVHFAWWIGALRNAGLGVDLAASHLLRLPLHLADGGWGDDELTPAFVSGRNLPAPDLAAFTAWALRGRPVGETAGTDFIREVKLRRAGPLRFVAGWHIEEEDEHGPVQARVVVVEKADGRPVIYMTSTRGTRNTFGGARRGETRALVAEAEAWVEQQRRRPETLLVRPLAPDEQF